MKILIVDDQATVRTAMRSVLTKLGFNSIIQADDGDTALEQLKKDKDIGLIISDMHMPQISGLELLETVKLSPELKKIPFIMVTTDSDMKTVSKATQSMVSGYIIKPFTEKSIGEKLKVLGILEAKPASEEEVSDAEAPPDDVKILIADDQATMRKSLRLILTRLGFFDIVEAGDGYEAIKQLRQTPGIGLIISDMHMPKMTGLEFLESVRLNPGLKHIPFIIVSTDSDMKTVVKATQSGVNSYIIKPFTEKAVKEKLLMLGIDTELSDRWKTDMRRDAL
ncbi:MAG: hypothetical protein BWK80_41100 [Desulfobacteraceae bacterium IS3]|nr:MAG: hypothetical protein BWK80_41100 [Desulfobacteraceae bacterium IS3]